MSRRQSYPQQTQSEPSLLEQIKDLKHEIQLKTTQIQDLKFQLNTLKKKQSIWYHLGQTYEKANIQQQRKNLITDNQKLKSQIISMLGQIQRKSLIITQQNQKINDLKQYNIELKKLSEKAEQIHKKQLEFMQSGLMQQNQYNNNNHNNNVNHHINYNQNQSYNNQNGMNMNMGMNMNINWMSQLQKLRREKQKLQIALSQCGNISKQMQDYYMTQIQKYKTQLQQQKNVIIRLQTNKTKIEQQLKRKQLQLLQIKNKNTIKNRQSQPRQRQRQHRQNQLNQLIKRQNLQKKWQIILTQIRQGYQKQIYQLKQHIKFQNVKLQNIQQNKTNYDNLGLASSILTLTQSKMGMSSSSASNQSFRFTANNSFSSSIKQSLSRRDRDRDIGVMKTPSKSSRQSNNFSYLLDRTNL